MQTCRQNSESELVSAVANEVTQEPWPHLTQARERAAIVMEKIVLATPIEDEATAPSIARAPSAPPEYNHGWVEDFAPPGWRRTSIHTAPCAAATHRKTIAAGRSQN